jgi:hypothetical protein
MDNGQRGDNKVTVIRSAELAPFMETKRVTLQVSLHKSSPLLNHRLHYFLPLLTLISPFRHPLKRENLLVFRVT